MGDSRKQRRIEQRRLEAKKRLRREEIKLEMTQIKNPVVNSIAYFVMWLVIISIFLIVGILANELGVLWNINTASIVGLVISLLWALTRIGIFESSLFKFKKYRDSKIVKKQKINVPNLTRDEYKEYIQKKSWIGVILLALFCSVTLVISILVLSL